MTSLVLHRDFKVNDLVGKGADGVVEAEAVLAAGGGGEDVVSLTLLLLLNDDLFALRLAIYRGIDGVRN